MSKMLLLVVSMVAVLAAGAVTAASATAASFELGSGSTAEIAEEPTVTENLVLGAEKEPQIECSKVQVQHGILTNGSPLIKIGSIHFDGCKDKSSEACEVGTITTGAIKDTLEENGSKGDTVEKFAPSTGKELASFKLTGSGCETTEKLLIDGDFLSKQEDNEESDQSHKLAFGVASESGDQLEYGDQLEDAFFRFVLILRLTRPVVFTLL